MFPAPFAPALDANAPLRWLAAGWRDFLATWPVSVAYSLGFTVLGFNRDDIEETFGIRGILEGYAARLATIKHHPRELKVLEKKAEEFQECLSKKQMDSLPVINTEFHELLYALSKSPQLVHIINGLRDQIYRFREIILKDQKHAGTSHEDHMQMLKFMRKRDAEEVERLVREHILRGQEVVLTGFGKKITNND